MAPVGCVVEPLIRLIARVGNAVQVFDAESVRRVEGGTSGTCLIFAKPEFAGAMIAGFGPRSVVVLAIPAQEITIVVFELVAFAWERS